MIEWPTSIKYDPVNTEAEFKVLWQQTSGSPLSRAVQAGIRADRLSWVFIAGYQSAVRLAFDKIPGNEWWSFAVSEDQSGQLSGVTIQDKRLSGTKTWVAACDNVDGVIVTAAGKCFLLPRSRHGVVFNCYAESRFLPDMSTGKVTLNNTESGQAAEINMDFRLAEPLALMAASAGYLWREGSRLESKVLRDEAQSVVERMHDLDTTEANTIGPLYASVADLGKHCGKIAVENEDSSQADWQQNGRLLSLYRKSFSEYTN